MVLTLHDVPHHVPVVWPRLSLELDTEGREGKVRFMDYGPFMVIDGFMDYDD